jgi:hypothetical protein
MTYEPPKWKCRICGEEYAPDPRLIPHCEACWIIESSIEESRRKEQMIMRERIKEMNIRDSLSNEEEWTVFVLVLFVLFLIALGGFYLLRWLS